MCKCFKLWSWLAFSRKNWFSRGRLIMPQFNKSAHHLCFFDKESLKYVLLCRDIILLSRFVQKLKQENHFFRSLSSCGLLSGLWRILLHVIDKSFMKRLKSQKTSVPICGGLHWFFSTDSWSVSCHTGSYSIVFYQIHLIWIWMHFDWL